MRFLNALVLCGAMIAISLQVDAQQTPKSTTTDPKTKTDPKAKVDSKAKTDPQPKQEFKGKLSDVTLGTHVSGPTLSSESLRNRVVLLDLWGVNCAPCLAGMPSTAALNAELSEFGLLVIGSHVQEGSAEKVRLVAQSRGANFPIVIQARLRTDVGGGTIPRCYLFDHKGEGIFTGLPKDSEPLIRIAVGKMIVDNAGKEKFNASVQPIANELKAGKSPALLLARVNSLRAAGGEAGKDAQALYESMTSIAQARLKEAERLLEASDALSAFVLIEKMPNTWKGTGIATKATDLITKLKKDKSVTTELSARPMLDAVKKLETPLLGTTDTANPTLEDYQKKYAAPLKALKAKIVQMSKTYPDAVATKQAVEIAAKYSIDLGEK